MRVLVVEESKTVARTIKRRLESECMAVDVVHDGEEGSYLGRTNEYDAIIVNESLPRKSGKEVCADIRRQQKCTPILVLSEQLSSDTAVHFLSLGVDDCVNRSISADEVSARIKALLRRPRTFIEETLCVDDLVLESHRQRVCRAGREIRLTRKEFMLLEYLLRNAGRVISRASILEHVWDRYADPFSNTLESHVLSLRKKIFVSGAKKLIQTVPGRGYILEAREDA